MFGRPILVEISRESRRSRRSQDRHDLLEEIYHLPNSSSSSHNQSSSSRFDRDSDSNRHSGYGSERSRRGSEADNVDRKSERHNRDRTPLRPGEYSRDVEPRSGNKRRHDHTLADARSSGEYHDGYRVLIHGLPDEIRWRELKELLRDVGPDPSFVDILGEGEGVAVLGSLSDADKIVRYYDGRVLRGKTLRLHVPHLSPTQSSPKHH